MDWWTMNDQPPSTSVANVAHATNAVPEPGAIGGPGPVPTTMASPPFPGEVGSALYFDGATYATAPSASFGDPEPRWTIDAWVYANLGSSLGLGPGTIVDQYGSGVGYSNSGYVFYINSGTPPTLNLQIDSLALSAAIPTTTLTGWQHVAVTVQPTTFPSYEVNFYLNGVQLTTSPSTFNLPSIGLPIDASYPGVGSLWIGKSQTTFPSGPIAIDDLEIWNRTLSQNEIQLIVSAGSLGKCPERPLTSCMPGTSAPLDISTGTNGNFRALPYGSPELFNRWKVTPYWTAPGIVWNSNAYTWLIGSGPYTIEAFPGWYGSSSSSPPIGPGTLADWIFPYQTTYYSYPDSKVLLSYYAPGSGSIGFGVGPPDYAYDYSITFTVYSPATLWISGYSADNEVMLDLMGPPTITVTGPTTSNGGSSSLRYLTTNTNFDLENATSYPATYALHAYVWNQDNSPTGFLLIGKVVCNSAPSVTNTVTSYTTATRTGYYFSSIGYSPTLPATVGFPFSPPTYTTTLIGQTETWTVTAQTSSTSQMVSSTTTFSQTTTPLVAPVGNPLSPIVAGVIIAVIIGAVVAVVMKGIRKKLPDTDK